MSFLSNYFLVKGRLGIFISRQLRDCFKWLKRYNKPPENLFTIDRDSVINGKDGEIFKGLGILTFKISRLVEEDIKKKYIHNSIPESRICIKFS